jgi:hypothetical protein
MLYSLCSSDPFDHFLARIVSEQQQKGSKKKMMVLANSNDEDNMH